MSVVGIIAEYNPLHNGHAWHLAATRESLDPEGIVVVMSGHFTQRGEPAIVDKWSRAYMAIACGADLVIELPTVYACSRATWFAHGAISLLSQLGIVTHLSFGSEAGSLEKLTNIAQMLEDDPPELRVRAQELAKLGLPHPRAQAEALSMAGNLDYPSGLISTANNILAVEYLRTIMREKSKIIPWTVKRQGSGYHDIELGPLASATAIRRAILAGEPETCIANSMPEVCNTAMQEQLAIGRGPISWRSLESIGLAALRRSTREDLAQLPEISEGLENRLFERVDSPTIDHWLHTVKTKRYTRARITRSLVHLLLGINKADLEAMRRPIPYARVLALNAVGRTLLRRCRDESQLQIIHKPKHVENRLTEWGDRLLHLDRLATDLWVLGAPSSEQRAGAQDLSHEPVRLF